MNANQDVLTQAGTNELEILIFGIGEERFGINIAKVREVIRMPEIFKPPQTHPIIEGAIHLRDQVLPLINLRKALGYLTTEQTVNSLVIIAEFHQQWFGFLVDCVDKIVRISWEEIEQPTGDYQNKQVLTGIAHYEDELVLMLDVESLTLPLFREELENRTEEVNPELAQERGTKCVLTVDDSGMIRSIVQARLIEAGYSNIVTTENGAQAWDYLQQNEIVDLVITDIEMPQIDGLHLTKLIKTNETMKNIPVIIYSSIISDDNRNKGEQVGVDLQLSKPEINKLVTSMDKILQIAV